MSTNNSNRDALVVGICQYDDLLMSDQLTTLAKQAEQLAQLLENQGGFKVSRLPQTADLKLDLKRRVTLPELEKAIEKLLFPPKESPTQTALLFFAGHGLVKETKLGKEGFLATSEADGKSVYGISLKWLRDLLRKSPVKQQIVFLEACHSGAFFSDFQADKEHDYCFVTSARANEEALAEGLLTKALLEILDCKRRLENFITSEMLIRYLDKIQAMNPGWQRFVYRTHGQEIVLCGATALKEKPQNRVTNFLLSVTITIFLIGFIVYLDAGNNKTAETNMSDKIEVKSPVPTTVKPFQTTVKAEQDWQTTGFSVSRGEKILIKVVSGQWNAADGFLLDNDGRGYGYSCAQSAVANKDDETRCPLRNYSLGALIASIGKTKYGIGKGCTFVATDNGDVFLRMNDNNSMSNSGELTVELSRTPTATISDQKVCGQPSTLSQEWKPSKNKVPAQLF